ncbi:MAG: P-loop ATPase, Sll1717 family [Syntrophales bacterium]
MHEHKMAAAVLQHIDLGSTVAELDTLLETARVETSAFTDLLGDKVDLVPGTKGSGKTALFRIFVDFLPQHLLKDRKVVIAHGVQKHGDSIFLAFKAQFQELSEDDFVSFWCIYLISLAHEQFIKGEIYQPYLQSAGAEIDRFRRACEHAKIPEIRAKKSLHEVMEWTLLVLRTWAPSLRYKLPQEAGEVQLDIFGNPADQQTTKQSDEKPDVPRYVAEIKETLEAVLRKSDLAIWLMIDRLDEIFPRRSDLETRALRGLLRTMRLFTSPEIRIKVFLRDDMLEHAISQDGFTALTHLTARQADTLRWSQDQILTMLVKRLFADEGLRSHLAVDEERLDASQDYRLACYNKVFPPTVHSGPNQSPTIRWMYNHTMDGKGVVTPRDIIELVTRAKQFQQDAFKANPEGESPWLIGPQALLYGLAELSKRRKETYLMAEFPHLWPHIEKFQGGRSEYSMTALQKLLGKGWQETAANLVSVGFLRKRERSGEPTFWIPYLYRKGMALTQGKAD